MLSFLCWDIVGHLSIVHFRFKKETGIARLRFVKGLTGIGVQVVLSQCVRLLLVRSIGCLKSIV